MAADDAKEPDLRQGVSLQDFGDNNMLRGQVDGEPVLLARVGDEFFAIGATCTHYGAPLDTGLVDGEMVRCPWHHARFSLRSGEAIGAPAYDAVSCWQVERDGERVFVRAKASTQSENTPVQAKDQPQKIVIIGGGGAGFACAEMLRRRGYVGELTMLSAAAETPCDRPSLSKGYLAGAAGPDAVPLYDESFYRERNIQLHLDTEVREIDPDERRVTDQNGNSWDYDRLLLATGSEPNRPPITGADKAHVFTLRTPADSDRIIERAQQARSAVVLGSGFIGLEVAASLTKRGLQVHVVTLDSHPLGKVLGEELSDLVRSDHEKQGVIFHTETSLDQIDEDKVTLDNGKGIAADLVVLGVGVKPRVALAEQAGLDVDNGVLVDEYLQTSAEGIYAAGDIANWPDATTGQRLRVEHWVLAGRHGQAAARNLLGEQRPFKDVPFFWSGHFDVKIRYMGHVEDWDETEVEGDVAAGDCLVRYKKNGTTLAVATVGRDVAALEWEAETEAQT
ncbi:MAG TPA: FAD-dependent oxidoreductase [Salinisphaeraceae bacterium]|nr:FAD-dependent oxidoreductase [Salinisphaeraceae bacterium]